MATGVDKHSEYIIDALGNGVSFTEVGRRLNVNRMTIHRFYYSDPEIDKKVKERKAKVAREQERKAKEVTSVLAEARKTPAPPEASVDVDSIRQLRSVLYAQYNEYIKVQAEFLLYSREISDAAMVKFRCLPPEDWTDKTIYMSLRAAKDLAITSMTAWERLMEIQKIIDVIDAQQIQEAEDAIDAQQRED